MLPVKPLFKNVIQLTLSEVVKLYIFRHGETDWNRGQRLQGSIDIPLNAIGIAQAHALGERIKHLPVEHLITSPRLRALQTARVVSHHTNWDLTLIEDLREAHLGKAEGLTHNEVETAFGVEHWQQWKAHHREAMTFGFHEGEQKQQVLDRALACIEQFIDTSTYHTLGVSTHGAVLRYILSHALNYQKTDLKIENCCLFEFIYSRKTKEWTFVAEVK